MTISAKRKAKTQNKSASSRARASKNSQVSASGPSAPVSTELEPSAATLLSHIQQTTEDWYRSSRTTKAYANYVKSGILWLKSWVEGGAQNNEVPAQMEGCGGEERAAFESAFDKISSITPTALQILLAYKCDHLGKGFSTAEGLRSAFKQYFERFVIRHSPEFILHLHGIIQCP